MGRIDDPARSFDEVRVCVVERLRDRQSIIEQAICARTHAVAPDPTGDGQPEYQAGHVAAITATVAYSLNAIERGGEWGPIPEALAEQARRAARGGMRAGTLVRRYLAGHGQFMDFVREEFKRSGCPDHDAVLENLRGAYGSLLDHIVVSMEHEFEQERERIGSSPDQRRASLVRRLLIGDVDPTEFKELGYEFLCSWHLGFIALDAEGEEALRHLKFALGPRLLSVQGDNGTVWAWSCSKAEFSVAEFRHLLAIHGCPHASLAIGEPGSGLDGWRQTHQEAQVAALIARGGSRGLTRCADALPVVGALQSEAIIRMYERTYILPLNRLPRGGQAARRVLRAYFKHGRSAASAAQAIGTTDRTIRNHLNETRKLFDAPLNMTGLEIALRLEELGYMVSHVTENGDSGHAVHGVTGEARQNDQGSALALARG